MTDQSVHGGKKGASSGHKQMLKEINKSLQHLTVRPEIPSGLTLAEQQSLHNLANAAPGDRKSFPSRSNTKAYALEEIRNYLQQFRSENDHLPSRSHEIISGTPFPNDRGYTVTDLHRIIHENNSQKHSISERQHFENLEQLQRLEHITALAHEKDSFKDSLRLHHNADNVDSSIRKTVPSSSSSPLRAQGLSQAMPKNATQAQRLFGVAPQIPRSMGYNSTMRSAAALQNRYPVGSLQKRSSVDTSRNAYVTNPNIMYEVKHRNNSRMQKVDRPRSAIYNSEIPISHQTLQAIASSGANSNQRPRSDIFPSSDNPLFDIGQGHHAAYDRPVMHADSVPNLLKISNEQSTIPSMPSAQVHYEGVVLRQKKPEQRHSQKRWSAEVLQPRGTMTYDFIDKRSSLEIVPSKPPPPYPGMNKQGTAALKRIASQDNLTSDHAPKLPTKSNTVIPDKRNSLTLTDRQTMTEEHSMFSNSSQTSSIGSSQLNQKEPPPYEHPQRPSSLHMSLPPERNVLQPTFSNSSNNSPTTPPGPTNNKEANSHHQYANAGFKQKQKVELLDSPRGLPPPYPGTVFPNNETSSTDIRVNTVTTSESGPNEVSPKSDSTSTVSSPTSKPDQVERSYSPIPSVIAPPCDTLIIHNEKPKEKPEPPSDPEPFSKRLKNYTPQAYKFYMEQHVENLIKFQEQRKRRRQQLEAEMTRVGLSEQAQDEMRKMLNKKESNYVRLRRAKMNKSMFTKIKTVGVGAFGEVSLVCKNDSKAYYAMKTLRKSEVIRRKQVAHVKAERDILAEADNAWVVKLYYSFQDETNLYFIMEYIPGGDLMALLIKLGIFDAKLALFYISELILAIASVHKLGFIHRDIKPDNVLINANGHIKLTDFGLCTGFRWTHDSKYYQPESETGHSRQVSMEPEGGWESMLNEVDCDCSSVRLKYDLYKPLERRAARRHMRCTAHSLVGTPNYIAPEVLMRVPYSQSCDWWSVGVILYEMLVGSPPFVAPTPAETQRRVINWRQTLNIPRGRLTVEAADLICRLCTSAEERIGSGGLEEILSHPYFDEVNFNTINQETAPHIPHIKHVTDTSNFDPVPEKLNEESDSDVTIHQRDDLKGEFAFYEFTFRHFFDECGYGDIVKADTPKSDSNQKPQTNNKRSSNTSQKSMTVPNKISAPNELPSTEEKTPIYV